ncbi:MAG: ribosome biogenesis GTP-binding protein YihA/YsxC [Polyangiales bacterium]
MTNSTPRASISATPNDDARWDVLDASFLTAAMTEASMPPPTIAEVAFAGRSNVGKSSMMNALMQRRALVRTSSTPGCTRGINMFHARTRGGLELNLVDLPGYGFAKRSKQEKSTWGALIEQYLIGRPTLRAVLLLIDARRGLEADDHALIEFCSQKRPGNAPVVVRVIATKLDLVPKSKRKPTVDALAKSAGRPVHGFSASEAIGRIEAWRAIERAALMGDAAPLKEPE